MKKNKDLLKTIISNQELIMKALNIVIPVKATKKEAPKKLAAKKIVAKKTISKK